MKFSQQEFFINGSTSADTPHLASGPPKAPNCQHLAPPAICSLIKWN